MTFEKIREPTAEELQFFESEISDFRERYYIAREETRKDRRMKEAKTRQENREKYEKTNNN